MSNDSEQKTAIERSWRKAFLAALRQTGNVRRACEACDIGRTAAYALKGADPTFAAEWDEAQEDFTDILEEEAVRRAMGTRELVIHQGKPCGIWMLDGEIVTDTTPGARLVPLYENRYSDGLIQVELRGRRPKKYAPPKDSEDKPAGAANPVSVVLPDNARGDGPDPVPEVPSETPSETPQ